MERRKMLDLKLKEICPNVYFQPPESVKISYPCIIYRLDNFDVKFADDRIYQSKARYKLTFVTKNPDDNIIQELLYKFKMRLNSFYTADHLNHYVYTLYY